MVFNSATVMAVAQVSTDTWQLIWRVPSSQRINTEQLVDMAVCYPMHQLSRFALSLWTFMCLPSSDSFYSYNYETTLSASSSSSSSSDADDDDRLAFDHNDLYNHRDYYSDDDRSSSSFDDYYDQYSHSD